MYLWTLFLLAFVRFKFVLSADNFSKNFSEETVKSSSTGFSKLLPKNWDALTVNVYNTVEEEVVDEDFFMFESYALIEGYGEEFNKEDDRDSQLSSSILSETYLEDLGLRSPRVADDPFFNSYSPTIERIRSSNSKLHLLKSFNQSEDQLFELVNFENEEEDDDEPLPDLVDEESGIYFGYENGMEVGFFEYSMETIIKEGDTGSSIILSSSLDSSSATASAADPLRSKFLALPDALISGIMEYCDAKSLLECRSTCKPLNSSCGDYLELLYSLTYSPKSEIPEKSREFKKLFSHLTIMLTFYRNQPNVFTFIQELVFGESSDKQRYWDSMSLIDLYDTKGFHNLLIFSDSFIEFKLIPHLRLIPLNGNGISEPSPLFLLGEALIRSRRTEFFDRALLPVLNQSVLEMTLNLDLNAQEIELMSFGFLDIEHVDDGNGDDNEVVDGAANLHDILGATLHCAINSGLILTVIHLISINPSLLKMKNHEGKTALMLIADILKKYRFRQKLPGPDLSHQSPSHWIADLSEKFFRGKSLQGTFPGNSRLIIEMFLGIVQLVLDRVHPNDPQAVVEFLGLNDSVEFLTENSLQPGSIMIELVSGLQYDIIFWLGLYFGDWIDFQGHPKTPLHIASEMNDPAMVAILLQLFPKLDVNQPVLSGNSALDLAVNGSSLASIKVLLGDPRCDPNRQVNFSPLVRSIELDAFEIVQILLAHPQINIHIKFKPRRKNSQICFALKSALLRHNWTILELLLRHPTSHEFSNDSDALAQLSLAESILLKRGDRFFDLLQLIKAVKMPTIKE